MNYQHLAHKALYMLRSYPELYGLRKDAKGWFSLPMFLAAMRLSFPEFYILWKQYIGIYTRDQVEVKHGKIRIKAA